MNKSIIAILLLITIACAPQQIETPLEQPEAEIAIIENESVSAVPTITPQPEIEPEPVVKENVTEVAVQPSKSLLQELWEKAPKTYWTHEVVVSGNDRRIIVPQYEGNRLVAYVLGEAYWNTDTKEVYTYVGEIDDKWLNDFRQSNASSTDKTISAYYISERVEKGNVSAYYKENMDEFEDFPKTPVDWLEEYQFVTPIKIETSKRVIKLGGKTLSSDLKVYLPRKQGGIVIFTFDTQFNVPLIIEEFFDSEAKIRLTHLEFDYFDTISHYSFNRIPLEKAVKMPDKHVVITEDEWTAWVKGIS